MTTCESPRRPSLRRESSVRKDFLTRFLCEKTNFKLDDQSKTTVSAIHTLSCDLIIIIIIIIIIMFNNNNNV